ncbi:hypothetical protein SAMN02910418_00100 [Bowdeniella nasicola]|uniref:DUF2304 domain-containing protein n=1 Tax=Bowdeniella nasicola TaxID=208480 RepID=A0A1H3VJI0_9ACTO|nr:DUF2304 domain-containing protein [Bowdeniella nasicola]SDZ74831.1 hypothetical protein SAMN02910418_00100 [Bowdeniella nasicola]
MNVATATVTAPLSLTAFATSNRFWIQLLLIVGVVIAGVILTRSSAGARHQAIRRLLMALFAAIAVYFIIFPSAASQIARLVGVGRGADLLLYALVVAFFSFVATTFKRFSALERRITELSRQLAIARAPEPRQNAPHRQPITDDDIDPEAPTH